eukprot:1658993-Karenia_brevis.AAC.1
MGGGRGYHFFLVHLVRGGRIVAVLPHKKALGNRARAVGTLFYYICSGRWPRIPCFLGAIYARSLI